MSRYNGGWSPYVSVAQRRAKAEREMQKLRKQGHSVAPVIIAGRMIAATFWGKAWCENLESYHDYESRLPRGRSYVRNGSVVDLQIAPLAVTALVSGSSIYNVTIRIMAVPRAQWRSICRDCTGGIDSLVELLQGRFSKGVMERLCRQDEGLFPRPSHITFSCDCPDYASMCKHVAAALYGVGARLDREPELLFRLRAVDEKDLLAHLDAGVPLSKTVPAAGRILEADDISALFGLEMADGKASAVWQPDQPGAKPSAPKTSRSVKPASKQRGARKPAQPTIEPVETVLSAKQVRTKPTRRADKTAEPAPVKTAMSGKPRSKKAAGPPAVSKTTLQLTPDGFVKWWK
jgi:uncharacterized Zn finger protein